MGIINLQEDENLIKEITQKRALAAVPFAGRYRLIDFTLSSMVNSGIENVGVLLPHKSRSILDHLRSGKDWDLARKRDGLSYLPPAEVVNELRSGDVQSYHCNLDFIEQSAQKYVLLAGSQHIYNINFENALRFHQNTGADITMIYHLQRTAKPSPDTMLETAENGLVTDIMVNTNLRENDKAFMGLYLMDKRVFIDIVRACFVRGGTDFLIDGVMKLEGRYSVYGYCHEGYAARIDSLASYYQASMEMLDPKTWQEVFLDGESIHTKVKDGAPAKYKKDATVLNSMVANGCVVEGKVENSILFRGVKVGKGVHIKNSIIMQKCTLEEEALLENVICDKDVLITKGKWLKGAPNYPLIVEKGVVI